MKIIASSNAVEIFGEGDIKKIGLVIKLLWDKTKCASEKKVLYTLNLLYAHIKFQGNILQLKRI